MLSLEFRLIEKPVYFHEHAHSNYFFDQSSTSKDKNKSNNIEKWHFGGICFVIYHSLNFWKYLAPELFLKKSLRHFQIQPVDTFVDIQTCVF